MTDAFGKKGGKGGGAGSGAKEAPNTLQSAATARLIEIISHGECVGLADQDEDLLKAIYLDNTPVRDSAGNNNYNGILVEQRLGLPSQDPFTGFSAVESEAVVNQAITIANPRTYTVTNDFVDAVRVKVQIDGLTQQDTKTGDLNGASVSYKFERRVGSGTWELVLTEQLTDKCTTPQQLSYRIERPLAATDTDDWSVRVTRLTPDSDSITLQNGITLSSVTEITDSNLMYSGLAGVAITIDSKQFGSTVPVRSYDWIGMVLDVPSNYTPPDPYDPINISHRTYTGLWDGTFKRAWTDNPAWILWAMLTDRDWGLGKAISTDQVDKWTLYQIAQYCDEFVDDGRGGVEPRYRINTQITNSAEAFSVLQSIASTFRGMMYWSTGSVSFIADQPQDPIRLLSPSNVVNGEFTYTGAALKARHSVALVTWNNPADNFEPAVEVVEDPTMMEKFGWRPTEVVAWGCTSQGQANRMGRWILDTERYESEMVSFSVSYENADLRPGAIIEIYDPSYSGARFAGRFVQTFTTHAVLDAPIIFEVDKTYTLTMICADGTLVSRVLTNTPSETGQDSVTWDDTLLAYPEMGSTVTIRAESELVGVQRGQIKNISVTSVTFHTAVTLDSTQSYQITFTLSDGTTAVRAVTTTITGGTRVGTTNDYEHRTLAWATTLTEMPAVDSIAFVSAVGEGESEWVLFSDASDEGATLTEEYPFKAGYKYTATLLRSDGVPVVRQLINPGSSSNGITWSGNIVAPPIPGGMWGIIVSDRTPRKFKVINIAEQERGIFNVAALNYDPAKYDRIETNVILPPDHDTDFTLDTPPDPVTNIVASRSVVRQEDGTWSEYVQVQWNTPASPYVSKYFVQYQFNGGEWVTFENVPSNSIKFPSSGPGEYAIKVVAISMNGLESVPTFAGYTLVNERPFDGAVIDNVRVENDLGATTVGDTINFTTEDLSIAWDVLPPPNWPDQTVTNWKDPYLLYYEVKVYNTSSPSTVYGTYTPEDQRITIPGADIYNATAGGVRSFSISIAMVDPYGTYTATSQKFNNPAPATPTNIVLATTARGFVVTCDLPTDIDVRGTLLWVSTSNGFDPTAVAPTFDAPQTNFSVNGTSGVTYYVRLAHYDLYGKNPSSLNVSAQQSITVSLLGTGDIDPSALNEQISIVAGEDLAAGDLVNIYNDGGTGKARKANAADASKEAVGYVINAFSTGATATVFLDGTNTAVAGLTPGLVFLSGSVAGGVTNTPPSTSGYLVQRVGFAKSATELLFEAGDPVVRG